MTESAKQHSIIYARFMVAILLLAQILAYVDRQVVAIVVDPMKQDLSLTDTQVGWLYGVFAIFYALAGIPIARLADRKKRTNLIALGVLIWSAMTMFSGVAKNFWQILIARTGVGSAEAALVPAGTSLITDLFPPERVPLAVSVFNSGSVFGSGLAFVIGGTVLALIGESGEPLLPILSGLSTWQQFFIYCGAPGLLLVPVFLVVREPARAILRSGQAAAPVSDVLDFYRENRRLMVAHHLGFLAFSLLGFGFVFWSVSFLTRVHGMEPSSAAMAFGWIFMLIAPFGGIFAGFLAARMSAKGLGDANIRAAMVTVAIAVPSIFAIQVMPTPELALLLYVPAMFCISSPFGLAYGSLSVVAPERIRATVVSIFMLTLSLGMLLGPPLAGFLNERIFPGSEGIRYSMLSMVVVFGLMGLVLLNLSRSGYAELLRRAQDSLNTKSQLVTPNESRH